MTGVEESGGSDQVGCGGEQGGLRVLILGVI